VIDLQLPQLCFYHAVAPLIIVLLCFAVRVPLSVLLLVPSTSGERERDRKVKDRGDFGEDSVVRTAFLLSLHLVSRSAEAVAISYAALRPHTSLSGSERPSLHR